MSMREATSNNISCDGEEAEVRELEKRKGRRKKKGKKMAVPCSMSSCRHVEQRRITSTAKQRVRRRRVGGETKASVQISRWETWRQRIRRTRVRSTGSDSGSESDAGVVTESTTFTVSLPTSSARREILLAKHKDLHYVSAVANDSNAEKSGIVPGLVLRAISDPVKDGMWAVREQDAAGKTVASASLRNVKDAIGSTRKYDIELEFEKLLEVTAEMVREEEGDTEQESERDQNGSDGIALSTSSSEIERAPTIAEQLQAQQSNSKLQDPATSRIDRPDLYSDKWEGDQYVGSAVNELTILVGLGVAVPLIGIIIALTTRGTLWDVQPY